MPRSPANALFLPYLSGERTPHNDGAIRGAFAGLSHDTTREAMTQAVLEGVAFSFRDCLDALAASGTHIAEADVIGGGSRSPVWIGILASVLGITLHRLADGEHGGAFGAARLARLAATGEDPAAICTPPRRIEAFSPDPDLAGAYTERLIAIPRPLPRPARSPGMTNFFGRTQPIAYAGPDSTDPLAYRFYDKDRLVLGKRMEDHLRFAVAYWHSLVWPGGDPFGGETFFRPWAQPGNPMAQARAKADVAFDLFRLLDVPFFCFHDRDVAPEGARWPKATPTSTPSPTSSPKKCSRPKSNCSGAPPTCSPTPATWQVRPPTPIPPSSPTPPPR